MQVTFPEAIKRGYNVATFDFYDTLTLPQWNPVNRAWQRGLEPNNKIIAEMFRLSCEEWQIYIISDAYPSPLQRKLLEAFVTYHELPILGHMSAGTEAKVPYLEACNSSLHFDDDPYELMHLPNKITGILVEHPSDSMTDEDYEAVSVPRYLIGTS
jgi:hypothetical protein